MVNADLCRDFARLIVIVGPTGTGKSDLSLHLAEHFQTRGRAAEIVNADAMQLYRGMDIGTAKLASGERQLPGARYADHVDRGVSHAIGNERLARRIAEEGCIVSEYSLGTPPVPANFPRRNRLISGLACAVLVVEAAAQSGSLITAHVAVEQGRDVFAIPGSIHSPLAKGCHKLIKEGAKLVESVGDLLTELCLAPVGGQSLHTATGYCGAAHPLLEAMGQGPVNADALAALTDTAPAFLAGQLLSLELAGQIERLPGGLFQRVNR